MHIVEMCYQFDGGLCHIMSYHLIFCQKFAELAGLKWGSKPTWKCLKQPMTGDAPPGIKSDQHHGFANKCTQQETHLCLCFWAMACYGFMACLKDVVFNRF